MYTSECGVWMNFVQGGVVERRPVRTSRDVMSGGSSRPRHRKVLYFPHRRLWTMEYSCNVWCKPCRRRLIPRQHSRLSWRLTGSSASYKKTRKASSPSSSVCFSLRGRRAGGACHRSSGEVTSSQQGLKTSQERSLNSQESDDVAGSQNVHEESSNSSRQSSNDETVASEKSEEKEEEFVCSKQEEVKTDEDELKANSPEKRSMEVEQEEVASENDDNDSEDEEDAHTP
ncbi:hypothetical protein Taro_010878 [Colocasia esculenta]|uniref:Uncharacterized protein n=1 Tax=Colocasia esculenta TaxID=4460 RepID=A0A843U8P8_COLES|nr:hypothetical protein [Colocasia esculenta]